MTIEGVQLRIAQIQSMMAAAARTAAPAGATGAPGPVRSNDVAAATSGAAFASVLAEAVDATGGSAGTGWTAPTTGSVSSHFGPRWGRQHEGVDIAAGTGTPVVAAGAGVVRKASWYGGYGNTVIIDHGGGVTTLYGHNSQLNVQPGERVRAGQTIAKVGSTGDSTGPHLHFEVEVDGTKVDPAPWLRRRGVRL